jgi:putative endonuclease
MKGGWVYIMTNRPNGTLYIGVTNDVARRAFEHRTDVGATFAKRYSLHRVVHAGWHDDVRTAIQREKTVKQWPRAWKVRLIERDNLEWRDSYEDLLG